MTTRPNVTEERPFYEVLADVFERGDQASVAVALGIPRQHVNEWLAAVRRDPLEAVVVLIETLRRNGNAQANEPFLALSRRLGFVAYPLDHRDANDSAFAEVLTRVADLVGARAHAEAPGSEGGARFAPGERRQIAHEVDQLIESATAYRDAQVHLASTEERSSLPTTMRRVR